MRSQGREEELGFEQTWERGRATPKFEKNLTWKRERKAWRFDMKPNSWAKVLFDKN